MMKSADAEEKPLKYMAGMLRASQLEKMMTKEELEEEQRMNGALTKGYEEDVGNKTSVFVHTAYSLYSTLLRFRQFGYDSIPQDEDIKYVMIPEGLRDFQWLQGLLKGKEAIGSFKGVRYSNKI
ncbi:Alpha-N-acetylgalactosaminide alpha-2,6-sialyltransferase 1 [Triplophysa tibetana]|uniref:alpha-N-acetylgalactosaminide alpha-2,6-sialyltransferase n=1 Tax=Triplophysa tibetana TaxID=1572043 RepID=A0A5A9PTT5_9TELE|nr:Alpha-N-acetylgalactosaminide alpha-2,6-sialyltransferase 1 [Triplophysa tibetana]